MPSWKLRIGELKGGKAVHSIHFPTEGQLHASSKAERKGWSERHPSLLSLRIGPAHELQFGLLSEKHGRSSVARGG